MAEEKKKQVRKTKVGVVVSDRMAKTVVVQVERRFLEPQFKKYITRRTKFFAQDEKKECRIGDTVCIQESRPFSKKKSWKIVAILKKGFGGDEVVL